MQLRAESSRVPLERQQVSFPPTSPQQAQTRKAFVTVTYFSCPSGAFQKGMKGGAACVAASAGLGAAAEMVYTKGQETIQTVFRSK